MPKKDYDFKYDDCGRPINKDGRRIVACDDHCEAFEEPVTLEEYKAALEHWKSHEHVSGCSHGC